ncbi:MAG: aminotransferase [Planctomycetaceae bacterium]|nr:aminotransferase [Planctomycetaceae bacterium]
MAHSTPTPDWAPWPVFGEDEITAVTDVLASGHTNYWTGPHGRAFEREYAESVGCRHGVAVANGTVALELALEAIGIGEGDEVIVPCRSFLASASAIVQRRAIPIFADVDRDSGNITVETIQSVLTPRSRGVLVVHLAGWPCNMDPIRDLATSRGLAIIEDCAQAHGARDRDQPVGSLGDIAAFSFCQDKILSTGGEGGLVVTNDDHAWRRAWSFKDHGKDWDAVHAPSTGTVFRYVHGSLGTNWRLTEMQSALGRILLGKLPGWISTRRNNAAVLQERLAAHPSLRIPIPPPGCQHSFYKFYAYLHPDRLHADWSRDRVAAEISAGGIPCGSGACPEIYLEAAFDQTPWRPTSRLPVAQELGETSLMFQVHPGLDETHMHACADFVTTVLDKATRRLARAA